MIRIADRKSVAAALRVSLLTAAALLCTSLVPVHSQIMTSDDGAWEGSWRREYGWPRLVYQEFGTDASTRMVWWDKEGILFNGRLILASSFAVFAVALTLLSISRESLR